MTDALSRVVAVGMDRNGVSEGVGGRTVKPWCLGVWEKCQVILWPGLLDRRWRHRYPVGEAGLPREWEECDGDLVG